MTWYIRLCLLTLIITNSQKAELLTKPKTFAKKARAIVFR